MNYTTADIPEEVIQELSKKVNYFMLAKFEGEIFLFYQTLIAGANYPEKKKEVESFIKQTLDKFEVFDRYRIERYFQIRNNYDFTAGVRKFFEQLTTFKEVLNTGIINSIGEYSQVREQRNILRDLHDGAPGYLESRHYSKRVKEIDVHLENYERKNPDANRDYRPVFLGI